jgi:hypothetical protein
MTRLLLAATVALSLSLAGGLSAQDLRGTATGTAQFIQIRPIRLDTVPLASVQRNPDGTFTFEGARITCLTGFSFCLRYAAGDVEDATVFTQDVSFTAWGLGMQGLSATVLLRARADAGGGFIWPRSDDPFDAMLAYAELNRGLWRVRLGRQRTAGGLGFAGYDGASVLVQPALPLLIEAFGGRSLARGLDEPRNDALRGVEDFVLDRDAWLFGGAARFEPLAGVAIAARYQREIWSDRSGLLSERASLDVRAPLPAGLTVSASTDYDLAFDRVGKSNVTLQSRLRDGTLRVELVGRRYVPYFELWTVWGFFEPAAWHEAELRAAWQPRPGMSLRVHGGLRWYDDTETTVIFSELPDRARRAGAGLSWEINDAWMLNGDYAVETGFGAFLSTGSVSARWQTFERLALTFNAAAFQQIEEFRLGEGVVLGGGGSAAWEFSDRIGIDAGASVYRQTFSNRPNMPDWNQLRGFARLRIAFGSDPGRERTRSR